MAQKDENLKPDDPGQSERFVETAKRLEADTSGKVFEKLMDQIVKHHPDEKSADSEEE